MTRYFVPSVFISKRGWQTFGSLSTPRDAAMLNSSFCSIFVLRGLWELACTVDFLSGVKVRLCGQALQLGLEDRVHRLSAWHQSSTFPRHFGTQPKTRCCRYPWHTLLLKELVLTSLQSVVGMALLQRLSSPCACVWCGSDWWFFIVKKVPRCRWSVIDSQCPCNRGHSRDVLQPWIERRIGAAATLAVLYFKAARMAAGFRIILEIMEEGRGCGNPALLRGICPCKKAVAKFERCRLVQKKEGQTKTHSAVFDWWGDDFDKLINA